MSYTSYQYVTLEVQQYPSGIRCIAHRTSRIPCNWTFSSKLTNHPSPFWSSILLFNPLPFYFLCSIRDISDFWYPFDDLKRTALYFHRFCPSFFSACLYWFTSFLFSMTFGISLLIIHYVWKRKKTGKNVHASCTQPWSVEAGRPRGPGNYRDHAANPWKQQNK